MHVTATHFPLSSLRSLCDPFLLPDGQPARSPFFLFLSRVSSQPPAIIFTLPISLSDRLTQIFVFVTFRLAGGLPPTARSRAGECRSTTTLPATRTVSGRQGLRWPAYVDYIWWWCLDMLIGWYNNIDGVRVVQMEVTWWYENSFPQLMGTTVLYHDRLAFWGVNFNLVKYKREVNNIVGIERKTQSALFLDWNEKILVQQVRCAFNVCHSESARHCGSMGFKSQRSAIFIHECCRNSTKSSCVSSSQLSHVFCVTIVK